MFGVFYSFLPICGLPMLFKQPFPRGKMTSMDLSSLCLLLSLVPSYLTSAACFFCLFTLVMVVSVGWLSSIHSLSFPHSFHHELLWGPNTTQTYFKAATGSNPVPSFRRGIEWSNSNTFILFANRSILASEILEEI